MREISYNLSRSDYREFYVVSSARRLWRVALVGGTLLTALNAWTDYCRCSYITTHQLLVAASWGFGIALAACLGVVLLNAWSAGRIHDAMKPIAKGQSVSWDDEGVRLNSDFYACAYPWVLFKRSLETKRVIAAYLTSMSPLLFPKRAMSPEELADLQNRLRSSKSP